MMVFDNYTQGDITVWTQSVSKDSWNKRPHLFSFNIPRLYRGSMLLQRNAISKH